MRLWETMHTRTPLHLLTAYRRQALLSFFKQTAQLISLPRFRMVLKVKEQRCRLCIIALLVVFIKQTQGQTASSTTSSGPSSTSNYFAPLDDLSKYPNPRGLANQNFTRCCLRAVDEWNKDLNRQHIEVLSSQKQTGFKPFANREELSKTEEQFPCGAEYNHNKEGATRVKISYMWCKQNCGGWERSRSAVLEQWVQPFVGFILPAAVFCLNVTMSLFRS